MTRTTIDFGVDLGTTNSAIAVLNGVSTEIFKNNKEADITPSAVGIDKKGNLLLGERARSRSIEYPEDAYLEFKRMMGTDHVYKFKSNGQTRRPEELSAEILKSLRTDVQQRSGEYIEAAVITVPAAFELHQCDATRNAAQLAGFKDSPLVQEPVAAALAYGFQVDEKKTYWLVYDFGGGTFDVAIVKSEDGMIHVINHGGDNFLGGSDIDWAIVEKLLVPRILKEFRLENFKRGNKQWDRAFRKLKHSVENAKIDLSRNERTTLESVKFSSNGEEIEFECELKRNEIIGLAEPFISKSIEIAKRVLKEKNLDKGAIEKVILVGGPTLASYFREMLISGLGIPLDYNIDPFTVVARGAAVFAGTQRLNMRAAAPAAAGEYTLDLKHKPIGIDSAPMIGGKVSAGSVQDFSGFTLELVNTRTQWRSGKIPLKADGVFTANLYAEQDERNTFSIELYNASGRKQTVTPDTLTYTIGAAPDEQPVINSMGIGLANNERPIHIEKGRGLPLRKTASYQTVKPLKQGESGEVLRIPVFEGENEKADRNRLNGVLMIHGDEIRRDLPAGSEVEVTLKMDESRIVTVKAFVPLLDDEFETKIEMQHRKPNPDDLKKDYEAEIERFRQIKSQAAGTGGETAERMVEEVEALAQEVKESLAAAEADPAAGLQSEKHLLEVKRKLDEIADAIEWPTLISEAQERVGWAQEVADEYGTDKHKHRVKQIASQVEQSIEYRKPDSLRKRIEELNTLRFEILMTQPDWWVFQFQEAEKEQEGMTDANRAARLFNQGRDCMAKNNPTGLQNIVRQLWQLLPDEVVQRVQRGIGDLV